MNQKISLRANTWQKAYEPAIFALYSSYAAGSGKELAIDGRFQNVLKDPRNWAMLVGVLVIFGVGIFGITHIYGRYKGGKTEAKAAESEAAVSRKVGATGATSAAPAPPPIDSTDWRLAGRIVTPRGERAVLVGAAARLRVEDPALFVAGWDKRAMLDGGRVSAWSGPAIAGGAAAPDSSSVVSVGK